MELDRDGIISILIGLFLFLVAGVWKFMETGAVVPTILGLLVELVRGGLVGMGLLFIFVGLLFIFG